MSTPHNRAENGDFAKTVLMPGDPLRAKFIAETFLEDPRLVTDVRGMYGHLPRKRRRLLGELTLPPNQTAVYTPPGHCSFPAYTRRSAPAAQPRR